MSELIQKAAEYLAQDGMPVTYDGTSPSLQMGVDLEGTQYPMVLRAMDEAQLMAIYTYLPVPIPDDRLSEVALFIAAINQGLLVSNLELDTHQSMVRCRNSFIMVGNPFTHDYFREAFQTCFTTMHNMHGGVMSVIGGSGGLETVDAFWAQMQGGGD